MNKEVQNTSPEMNILLAQLNDAIMAYKGLNSDIRVKLNNLRTFNNSGEECSPEEKKKEPSCALEGLRFLIVDLTRNNDELAYYSKHLSIII